MIPFVCICLSHQAQRFFYLFDDGLGFIQSFTFQVFVNGAIPLEGGWEFYWHQLLAPDAFANNNFENKKQTHKKIILPVPSLWADQKKNHPEMAAHGFATYRLILHNVPYQTPLSLRVNSKMGRIRFG